MGDFILSIGLLLGNHPDAALSIFHPQLSFVEGPQYVASHSVDVQLRLANQAGKTKILILVCTV